MNCTYILKDNMYATTGRCTFNDIYSSISIYSTVWEEWEETEQRWRRAAPLETSSSTGEEGRKKGWNKVLKGRKESLGVRSLTIKHLLILGTFSEPTGPHPPPGRPLNNVCTQQLTGNTNVYPPGRIPASGLMRIFPLKRTSLSFSVFPAIQNWQNVFPPHRLSESTHWMI